MNILPGLFRKINILIASVLFLFCVENSFAQEIMPRYGTIDDSWIYFTRPTSGYYNPRGITFVTSSQDRVYLDKDGRLGIGIVPSTNRLEVAGDFRVSNAFIPSGSLVPNAGTSNIYIQALGNGNEGFSSMNFNVLYNGSTDIRNNGTKNGWKLYSDQRGSTDIWGIGMYPASGAATQFPFLINSTGNVSMDGNVSMAKDVSIGSNLLLTGAPESWISKDQKLSIESKSSDIRFTTLTARVNRLLIQNNGNVGIGVNYAAVGFHVAKNTMIEDNTAPTGIFKSSIIPIVPGNGAIAIGATTSYAWLQSKTNQPLLLNPASDGNSGATSSMEYVGIGFRPENLGTAVVPKGYMLAVNGSIICTAVKVKAFGNWSDFVFEPSYALQPLAEVEDYIHANKHLPNIPSAAEVNEHGFEMADMDAKFLRKIEELTLYMIEQNKETQAIKAELKLLRAENEALKIQITK